MPTGPKLMAIWRDLEPRQRSVAKVVAFWFVASTVLDSIEPTQPPRAWWVTLLADSLLILMLYLYRRSRHYVTWHETLRPQDVPWIDRLQSYVLPLMLVNTLARLTVGDALLSRATGLLVVAVLGSVLVLGAGARKPERPKRDWSLPWPFNVTPRVPPADN